MAIINKLIKIWDENPSRIILPIVLIALGVMMGFYYSGSRTNEDLLGGPTQFGQFGDYVGGLLNPIFGFLTVCLLISSAKHARKELNLSRQEYDRKQLETMLKDLYSLHDETMNSKYPGALDYMISLRSAVLNDRKSAVKHIKNLVSSWHKQGVVDAELVNAFAQLQTNILRIVELNSDILERTNLHSLKTYWYTQTDLRMMELEEIGILDFSRLNEFRVKLHKLLDVGN